MPSRPASHSSSRPGPESQTLTRLFQARSEWDRLAHLSTLLKETQIDLPDFFDSDIGATICREPDSEKLAWRLAREIFRRNNGKIPSALQPYLDRPDFEQQERAEEAESFRRKLLEWLSAGQDDSPAHPRRELRIVWKIESGFDPLESRVQIDLRVNSPKLKEGSRNFFQVRGLCNEAANRPELFNADDQVLLRWLSDFLPLLLTDKNRVTSPFLHDNRSLLTWLTQWGTSARCHWEDGAPVEFSPLSARIVPQLHPAALSENDRPGANNSRLDLNFEVVTAAGLREPLENARVFLAPKSDHPRPELELVCVKHCFYRLTERPPRSLMALALKRGVGAVDVAAASHLLPPLLRRYPHLQQQVKVHLRQVPSVIKFYFHLDEDDALQIRLKADAREGGMHWEWFDDGWTKTQSAHAEQPSGEQEDYIHIPPPEMIVHEHSAAGGDGSAGRPGVNDVEIWDDVPAEVDTTVALAWLRGFEAERGELCGRPDNSGWWVILQATRIPALLQHWKDRSPDWHYFANRRFQHLISGKRRRFPKLKIQSTGIDWFSVHAAWEDESLAMTEADWTRLHQSDDPYVKLSNGVWMEREEVAAMAEAVTALAEIGVQVGAGEQQVGAWQMSGAQQTAWKKLETLVDGDSDTVIRQLRQAVNDFKGLPEIDPPKGLIAELRPYQKTGLHFLAYASRFKLGALLADDMGLGKTVQALAWLQHMREHQGPAPTLVICPASVVFNWNREAAQFTPEQKVLLLTAGEHRHSLRQEIPAHDLVVTNYALLRRDLAALQKFAFRAIILDEAQNIKNPESMVARAAKALKAEHKLALTGTPLENRLLDLWSIMEFVHAGYLPDRSKFLEQYDRGASQPARALLSSRMRPVMLRRLKKQVAQDLPDRIEERIDCELTEGQRKFYLAELQRSRQQLSTLDMQAGQSRMHVLAALTRLRQICCHPSLAGGKKNLGSGKTSSLFDLLEPLYAAGHKVLVFSQFVEMLKILKAELEERGRPYFMLTGQTTQRGEVVQAFHDCKEPAVFLLSLKAAGTGLNLTSASYVVLYDPWWNPAVEAQAIDRTHRIGQDRTVIAYRLVTQGTVEEKIWRLQQSKAQMAQDVLGEEGFTGSLSKTDFDYLLEDTSEELEPTANKRIGRKKHKRTQKRILILLCLFVAKISLGSSCQNPANLVNSVTASSCSHLLHVFLLKFSRTKMSTPLLKFISLEGGEAVGKSTQVEKLAARLTALGQKVLVTREPGGTPLGESIRHLLKHAPEGRGMTPYTELLLFLASRAELVRKVIMPALDAGGWVISDRFLDSTTVYQGAGRQLPGEIVERVNAFAVGPNVPGLTLVLNLEPEAARQRQIRRSHPPGSASFDRMEAEPLDFFERVRQGYFDVAKAHPSRVKIVSAAGSVEETADAVWKEVTKTFQL